MEIFAAAARSMLGLDLTKEQLSLFEHYAIELTSWNQKINLTTIIDPYDILIKHFLDSLACMLAIRTANQPTRDLRIVDVGTGAGFPSLPLKIAYPQLHVTLVESVGKKCDFLRHIVDKFGLDDVNVLHERAEVLGGNPRHRNSYDWGLARAVAQMPALLEYLLPMVKVGCHCIALKGGNGIEEARQSSQALTILGGRVLQMLPVELPGVVETRYLVVVRKVAPTPEKYPRSPGVPTKRPLT